MSDSPTSTRDDSLHDAAQHGNAQRIELACSTTLPFSTDVDGVDGDGWTALHIAADRGHAEAVRALLELRACVDARDFNNDTALHIAASMGTPR